VSAIVTSAPHNTPKPMLAFIVTASQVWFWAAEPLQYPV
jgi:hypothetical protein